MRPEDVYALKGVSDPRLSPDGTTVAYVAVVDRRRGERVPRNIWLAPVDGSEPPRRFTTGERRDGEPRWSPDGSSLAFVSSRAEKEPGQLYVISLRGGEAQKLTKLKEDVRGVAWSPDGRTIAFTSRVRDEASEEEDERRRPPRRVTHLLYKLDNEGWIADRRSQVFVVPADGSAEPRQLTDAEPEHSARPGRPTASRSSSRRRAATTGTRSSSRPLPHVVRGRGARAADARRRRLQRPVVVAGRHADRVPLRPRPVGVGAAHADRRDRRRLARAHGPDRGLDRQCAPFPPQRSRCGTASRIVFGVEDGGSDHVYSVPADGRPSRELLIGGDRVVAATTSRRHGGARGEHADVVRRPLRRRQPRHRLHARSSPRSSWRRSASPRARRTGPGRGVARATRGLRGGQALPRPAQDPRRAVHAVRHRPSSTSSRCTRRRLRGRVREPARLVRLQRRLGHARSAGRWRAGPGGGPSTTRT